MGSINIIVLSMKLFLMSAGAVSLATGLKLCVPIAVNEVPMMWSIIITCLKPPFLYITINFIIITIAATSRFGHEYRRPSLIVSDRIKASDPSGPLDLDLPVVAEESTAVEKAIVVVHETSYKVDDYFKEEEKIICVVNESADEQEEETKDADMCEVVEAEMPMATVEEENYGYEATDCCNNYEKHDTLDSTWKMINDRNRLVTMTHSHMHGSKNGSMDIQKELSPGQAEVNRRVEEFIKKFNQDMRLQRQISLDQQIQTINRLN